MGTGTKLRAWLVSTGGAGCAMGILIAAGWTSRAEAGGCSVGTGTRIAANDAAAFDLYGQAVAVDGNTLVVGSWNDETPVVTGSAYVYERQAGVWQFVTKLLPPDGAAFDRFGWSVDIDGDTIAIGADNDDAPQADRGSAYVFVRVAGIWQFQQKIGSNVGAAFDRFGTSVSLSGNTLLIGAPGSDFEAADAGAAYVFTRAGTTWIQQAVLSDEEFTGVDNFGIAVALDGDLALVGANLSNEEGNDSGKVVPFTRTGTTWTPEVRLAVAGGLGALAQFGFSLAVSGDEALVGAPLSDSGASGSGAAHHFRRFSGAWQFVSTLVPPAPASNDQFGISIALSADAAVVGVLRGNTAGTDSGSALVFGRSGTNLVFQQSLNANGVGPLDQFGVSVAISADTIAVGANQDDIVFTNTGAAYAFGLNCGGGIPGDLNCDGIVSVGDIGAFVLALTDPTGYADAFPTCDINLGDVNDDGIVSVGDIGAFVALLTGA